MTNKRKKKFIMIPVITAIISVAALLFFNYSNITNTYKTYPQFMKDLNSNKLSKVYVTDTEKIIVVMKDGTKYKTDNPRSESFKETLLKDGINVLESSNTSVSSAASSILFAVSVVAIMVILFRSTAANSKKLLSVDAMDLTAAENVKHNFESVAGNEEAKESVKDVVDFLKNPEKYSSYGARMPRGVILYGDPGTGKTLLAKAVAGEANVPFYAMSGSDFVQVYVGVGASRIRNLFKKAKSHGKAVIFIDEIDAIGKARDSGKAGGSEERDQTLNALLTEMSGFNDSDGIIVMAATNRLDMLDSALLRPGRFDRHIEVTLPDVCAREKILNLHLKNKPVKDLNIKEWAQKTSYFSGAKLESLTNEAAILACKDDSQYITDAHMDTAFSIVIAGHEKKDRQGIKDRDKKITAYHEAGHALISMLMLPEEKVSKVTIIPSTKGAGGYTLSIPEDYLYQNMDYLKKRIMVLLGGRAAEDLIFGKDFITTGAYSDLKHSTSIAAKMVTEYGMGNSLGLLSLNELNNNISVSSDKVVAECKDMVDNLYSQTKDLLTNNNALLEQIAAMLLENETIYYEDLVKIVPVNTNSVVA